LCDVLDGVFMVVYVLVFCICEVVVCGSWVGQRLILSLIQSCTLDTT
jgi:hypothetical protein